ncbi:MAG TPA: 50S ribosomal protein L15 [bacterium]|nr:50S ribosomal protein L15 [bacterium]
MQLHQLHPKNKRKKRKRIGRGGKRGSSSGKGMKGQKSRSGKRFQPIVRELIKKYPKLKGYRFKSQIENKRKNLIVLNLSVLEKMFEEGEKITPKTLLDKKIIRRIKGRMPQVKILGNGEINKKLIIENCNLSKTAQDKIEKAKGQII